MRSPFFKVIVAMLFIFIPIMGLAGAYSGSGSTAEATTENTCSITAYKDGNLLTVNVCGTAYQFTVNEAANGALEGGGQVDLPTETITITPDTTVTLPPATVTLPPVPPITIKTPGPTVTLPPLPVPTETETLPPLPRATKTVTKRVPLPAPPAETRTIRPAPETVTISPEPEPRPTATVTVTEEPSPAPILESPVPATRQDDTEDGTIDPDEDTTLTFPRWELSAPEAAGLGTLAVLLIAGLILMGMYAGYYMGYKDSDQNEAKFIRALLNREI